jgi:hypothetical protein
MPPVGFAPTIPESVRQQTYALDRAATGIGEPTAGPKSSPTSLWQYTLVWHIAKKRRGFGRLQLRVQKKITFPPCIVKINGFRILTDQELHNARKTTNKNP